MGDPGREMGGDGGLGDTRPGGIEVLDVAWSVVFSEEILGDETAIR